MSSDRHRQASELFLKLLDSSAEEKRAILEDTERSDPALCREVEELLRFDSEHPDGDDAPDKEAEAPLPQVPGYVIEKLIGEGGMGSVWSAIQESTQRRVALKLLGMRAFASQRATARFEREVEFAARLEHPSIARVYDSGFHEGLPYYVMEFVEGIPLDEAFMQRNQRESIQLVGEVARAVAQAHHRGVIHRDLKPSNILVRPDGRPCVLDFGLAKGLVDDDEAKLSTDGQIIGTPLYMSPEQAVGDSDSVDTRTDVYALGVLLYQAITHRLPHGSGGATFEVLRRIAETDVSSPRAVVNGIDRDLEAVTLRALQRNPERRYGGAGELADDLERFLEGAPVAALPPSSVDLFARWFRRHWVAVGLGLALFAIAVVSTVMYTLSLQEARARADRWSYAYRIQLASRHLQDHEPMPAAALLDACPEKYRAWEWSWLRRQIDSSRVSSPKFKDGIRCLSFSPDESLVVVGTAREPTEDSGDAELAILDVATGAIVRRLEGPKNSVFAAIFSNDGRQVFSGGKDGMLRRHEVETGKLLQEVEAGWIFALAASPDGQRIAWATFPHGLTIFELETSASKFLPGPGGQDDKLSFNASGERLAWTYRTWQDSAAHVVSVDPIAGTEVDRKKLDGRIYSVSARANEILFGFYQSVRVWNVEDDSMLTIPYGDDYVLAEFLGADKIAFCDRSASISVLPFDSEEAVNKLSFARSPLATTLHSGSEKTAQMAVSPSGRLVCAGRRIVKFWDVERSPATRLLASHGKTRDLGAITPEVKSAPDGKRLAHIGDDGRLVVQEIEKGEVLWAFDEGEGILRSVSWFPDGSKIVSGWARRFDFPNDQGPVGQVIVHDAKTGEVLTKRSLEHRVWGIGVSPGGRHVAYFHAGRPPTTEQESLVVLLNPQTLERERVLPVVRFPIQRAPKIRFSQDGSEMALVNGIGFVVWDLASGKRLHSRQENYETGCSAISFHPDGEHVILAERSEVFLVRRDTFERVRKLATHSTGVRDLVLSADGERLITAVSDRTLRVWDFETGEAFVTVRVPHVITSIDLMEGGQTIVANGQDQVVRAWETGPLYPAPR